MDSPIAVLDASVLAARNAYPATHPGYRSRVRVAGKFLWAGDEKFWVKGVTYGTFRPREGCEYPAPEVVDADFAMAAASGINTIRTYTVPPGWLLDRAQSHGLRVMVGLAWEQHI